MSDHAFLAVDLSSDERHALSAALTEAGPGRPVPGKRPRSENWHITLRFLGECTESEAERIMFSLAETLDIAPTRVWCDGLGCFPRTSKAGVIYVAVDDPTDVLGYLAGVCNEAATDAGFEAEDRPFVPHLTLSRLRPASDVRSLLDGYSDFRVPVAVNEITLFRTRRTRSGVCHDAVDRVVLRSE